MRCVLSIVTLALIQTSMARGESLCAMTMQQAAQSPLCVRWHFTCQFKTDGKPSGQAALLSPTQRYRLLLLIAFQRAQHDCEIFSYQEALAAVQLLLLIDAPTPPPTFQPPAALNR